ncbi:hypothetical protein [Deinococcus cellulosilyticus]|uniref:Uncharacterized protein n=1 Tax=Deinococcus cellulosilyticus (strain DSM 18568 / NBRC 106333 / KACC 11606 / 5516J-15) TaxID=1223518 RepID=A0A511N4P1_DEIC1|nr:hypothetical protein [Deinococcus cellulosilyticus]GEM47812.1 hypothetical protein DC3_34470 [Deinococcus cellulosilyticus NBRC 106333 = KACC 11606]
MLAHHWLIRKVLALLGSGLILTFIVMVQDKPTDARIHPNLLYETLVFWFLTLWFGAVPALLVTGISDLFAASVGRFRLWAALLVHLSGIFPLLLLVNGYERPWGPENWEKLGLCALAVLSFFVFDELLRRKRRPSGS